MFAKVVPFTTLIEQGRWKVEFFLANVKGATATAYPLVPLKNLLQDRGEFLDPQQYPDHLFNYLGLEHILPVTGDLVCDYEPRQGRAVLSRSKVFRGGDILYGRLRPLAKGLAQQ